MEQCRETLRNKFFMGSGSIMFLFLSYANPYQTADASLRRRSNHVHGHPPHPKFRTLFNKLGEAK